MVKTLDVKFSGLSANAAGDGAGQKPVSFRVTLVDDDRNQAVAVKGLVRGMIAVLPPTVAERIDTHFGEDPSFSSYVTIRVEGKGNLGADKEVASSIQKIGEAVAAIPSLNTPQ